MKTILGGFVNCRREQSNPTLQETVSPENITDQVVKVFEVEEAQDSLQQWVVNRQQRGTISKTKVQLTVLSLEMYMMVQPSVL